jgi:hypothetical protein
MRRRRPTRPAAGAIAEAVETHPADAVSAVTANDVWVIRSTGGSDDLDDATRCQWTTYGLDAIGRIASRDRPRQATETYGLIGSTETVCVKGHVEAPREGGGTFRGHQRGLLLGH